MVENSPLAPLDGLRRKGSVGKKPTPSSGATVHRAPCPSATQSEVKVSVNQGEKES